MSKYTLGPWRIGARYGDLKTEILGRGGSRSIAAVWTHAYNPANDRGKFHSTSVHPEGEANACLIASAPELLEALDGIETIYAEYMGLRPDAAERSFELVQGAVRKARAIRAKAVGGR